MPEEDTMPHGCLFCELILEHGEEVRLWASDLPQWYYRMKVSAERAATNVFTKVLDGDRYRGLAAVQALLASEGRSASDDAPAIETTQARQAFAASRRSSWRSALASLTRSRLN